MYIKIMSDENLADESCHKGFQVVSNVRSFKFKRFDVLNENKESAAISVVHLDGLEILYPVSGNVYVTNVNGKTIEVFAHSPWHGGTN